MYEQIRMNDDATHVFAYPDKTAVRISWNLTQYNDMSPKKTGQLSCYSVKMPKRNQRQTSERWALEKQATQRGIEFLVLILESAVQHKSKF